MPKNLKQIIDDLKGLTTLTKDSFEDLVILNNYIQKLNNIYFDAKEKMNELLKEAERASGQDQSNSFTFNDGVIYIKKEAPTIKRSYNGDALKRGVEAISGTGIEYSVNIPEVNGYNVGKLFKEPALAVNPKALEDAVNDEECPKDIKDAISAATKEKIIVSNGYQIEINIIKEV